MSLYPASFEILNVSSEAYRNPLSWRLCAFKFLLGSFAIDRRDIKLDLTIYTSHNEQKPLGVEPLVMVFRFESSSTISAKPSKCRDVLISLTCNLIHTPKQSSGKPSRHVSVTGQKVDRKLPSLFFERGPHKRLFYDSVFAAKISSL